MKKRASELINGIYQHYIGQAERDGTLLDLDLSDPTLELTNPDELVRKIDRAVRLGLARAKGGRLTIKVRPLEITIHDNGPALKKSETDKLYPKDTVVKSRVGYGTRVIIGIKDHTPGE